MKEQFSREYHVVFNGIKNRPSEKGLLQSSLSTASPTDDSDAEDD